MPYALPSAPGNELERWLLDVGIAQRNGAPAGWS
jgi:hypothetical protein